MLFRIKIGTEVALGFDVEKRNQEYVYEKNEFSSKQFNLDGDLELFKCLRSV